jgi:predicted ATPase
MNKSLSFHGREKKVEQLRQLYADHRNVLIAGPAGIGKTALMRHVRQACPLLLCEETSSLRRICDGLERDLGWRHYKLNLIERKKRLIEYLARRGETVVFDHVALTPPRVARFMAHIAERVPIWMVCRSALASDIGRVWEYLAHFARIDLGPLAPDETRVLVETSADQGHIQADARAHGALLHRMSKGNPRVLEELLIELAARNYQMDSHSGRQLLDLDRRIHELDLAGDNLPNHQP